MKQTWSTPEYTLRQERRKEKFERRRDTATRKRNRPHPTPIREGPAEQDRKKLYAPVSLRLFDEPAATLRLCNRLRRYLSTENAHIVLDLRRVDNFTSDALLLIHAVIVGTRARNANVSGNLPRDPRIASEFKETGFFDGFVVPPENLPAAKGIMLQESHTRVKRDIAGELVRFARKEVSMDLGQARACFRSLIELMTNTNGHASGESDSPSSRQRPPRWFASVYCRNGVAYFNFVDLGVGILGSASAKDWKRKVRAFVPPLAHRLLEQAFQGKLGSVTGLAGRGLGLPQMKAFTDAGSLLGLQVLTANVRGSVGDLNFSISERFLRGTAFRWHLGHKGS